MEINEEIKEARKAKEIAVKHTEFLNGLFLLVKALIIFGILLISIQKNYFTYYKTQAVFGLIIGTSFFVFVLRKNDFLAPIIALILIGFLEIVDTCLWRYAPFSSMFTIEDFSGSYEGIKVSEYVKEIEADYYGNGFKSKEYKNHSKFTLKINQTGSKISIHSFCYKEKVKDKIHESKSDKVIILKLDNEKDYELIYHFKDIGIPKSGRYSGTANLIIKGHNEDFMIQGGFYTNRNPQTRGEFINLVRKSKKTIHPF